MILAIDTFYYGNKAKTISIEFENWNDESYLKYISEELEISSEYIPGEFYKRELPCIQSILKNYNRNSIEVIIIDGYVYLDDMQKFGLGAYLHQYLNESIPIIGVAKTNFATNELYKKELLRGKSNKPLFISSVGIDIEVAKDNISKMFGGYRIPKLLKELDQLTKQKNYG